MAHPASYTIGDVGFSQAVKLPGHEADHSFPPTAKIKKTYVYTSTPPPYVLTAQFLIS
jgi:hypothetical protein